MCRRLKFDDPVYGYALQGHVIVNLTIGKGEFCRHRCTMESNCLSFNLGPQTNEKWVCELSNSDHMRHPGDMKTRQGFFYRGTEVRNLGIVRRHNSKFRANCALFDSSMKFGTLIVDTKTSIFRYSAKSELCRFPWKPQFINIHGISLLAFVSLIISVVSTFRCTFCFIGRVALILIYALA